MELLEKEISNRDVRFSNRQFDRSLIKSFFSSKVSKLSTRNSSEMMKILRNLIEKKQVLLHCSDVTKEKLIQIYEKRIDNIESLEDFKLVQSKDNLIFLSF